VNALGFFQAVNRRNVGMTEGRQHLCLAAEPGEPLGIVCEQTWQ
jgi:hypothetical protein